MTAKTRPGAEERRQAIKVALGGLALVVYVRIAAERTGQPVGEICARLPLGTVWRPPISPADAEKRTFVKSQDPLDSSAAGPALHPGSV